tara:strand:+ start:5560 stop:6192 length:633 start_codon:yes stop_codon:yes gene_type:complete
MDEPSDMLETTKIDQGFISHVFNFDNKSKQEMTNTIQYALLAILPVVLLNKSIHRLIPEADETKASLEILVEILAQVGIIFIGIFFIHRVITYFPTYSEAKYESFSVLNCIISFLIIILSLQTKLGEKMNIIVDRFLMIISGTQTPVSSQNDQSLSEYTLPVLNNPPPQTMGQSTDIDKLVNNSPQQFQPENNIMAANETLGGSFFGSSF